jgi:hypothetical protein
MHASPFRSLPRVAAPLTVAFLTAPLLVACGSSTPTEMADVVLMDANNYTSTTTLALQTIPTKSGADLMVCWDGLMKDLLCHDINATNGGIDNVAFLQIPGFDHTQVANKLAVGQLDENLVKVYRDYHTSKTPDSKCVTLSQMILGTSTLDPATDYVEPAAGKTVTYMLLFASGTTPGVGSKAMAFLDPMAASAVTTVAAPDACAGNVLDFNATLGTPISISATDKTKWLVDWSKLTKDSFGNPVVFNKIDNVLLGFYQGKTAADLMTSFTDIEQIATTLYEVPVAKGVRNVDLAKATVKGGTDVFPGFTQTDGVWAMAVTCSQCQVPAPVALTILQPQ